MITRTTFHLQVRNQCGGESAKHFTSESKPSAAGSGCRTKDLGLCADIVTARPTEIGALLLASEMSVPVSQYSISKGFQAQHIWTWLVPSSGTQHLSYSTESRLRNQVNRNHLGISTLRIGLFYEIVTKRLQKRPTKIRTLLLASEMPIRISR